MSNPKSPTTAWLSWRGEKKHTGIFSIERGGHLDNTNFESLDTSTLDRL